MLCVCVFQLDYPNMVEGLLLININPCAEGWINWAAHKVKTQLNVLTFVCVLCRFFFPLRKKV